MPKNGNEECSGCKIPVCLEFTHVTATDEFKEEMTELFSEIFANLCSGRDDKPKPVTTKAK